MSNKDAQEIIQKCGRSSNYVTKEEFNYVMKLDGQKSFKQEINERNYVNDDPD